MAEASALIGLVGGLAIVGSVLLALLELVRGGTPEAARRRVAAGVLWALGYLVAATLLNTLRLRSWKQIGVFATVLSIRLVTKRVFQWEAMAPDAVPRERRAGSLRP